jgi:Asp-tRNA(Asn)/Glu-tRNA(Gln) amidotransferase A subunit family amidase
LSSALDAFWEYERALMANDLPTLNRLFLDDPSTLRGDAAGILVGHEAIGEFRKGRGGAPARTIAHVEVVPIDEDAALIIAVTVPASGGRGQQSQLWVRAATSDGAGEWRVRAAHVSLPTSAVNSSVWRVVGAPLIAGAPGGPLAGETVAVKDLYDVAGHAVGAGIPAYLLESAVATVNAPAVQALLDAGAAVTGIAQTDEFAYSIAGRNPHYGTPPNPSVVGGVPGGSSSGPASAVALGQTSIGLGTDTAGSIRVPASYQGLWGLRTTHGAVPSVGILPLAETFDAPGWLTRSSQVLRKAAAATLTTHAPAGAFIVAPSLTAQAEPDVQKAFNDFVGDRHETVELGDAQEFFLTFRTVQQAEAWRAHGAWVEAHPGALGDDVAARFALAAAVTPAQEAAARADLARLRAKLDDLLGDRVLLVPSASSSAPTVMADAELIERTRQSTLRMTAVAGLTGRPALSVPLLGVPQPGALLDAPVGLCLVGPRFSELALIDLGEQLAR